MPKKTTRRGTATRKGTAAKKAKKTTAKKTTAKKPTKAPGRTASRSTEATRGSTATRDRMATRGGAEMRGATATRGATRGATAPAAPAGVLDLKARVLALLEGVQSSYAVPPDYTEENKFFYHCWKSILQPSHRAPAFVGWLKELGASKNWDVDANESVTGLKHEQWKLANECLSGLYSGLNGALYQYLQARPVWKAKMLVGPQTVPGGTIGSEADIDKHHATQKTKMEELRKKMQAVYQKILDDIAAGLNTMQAKLRGDLKTVVGLFKDMSRVEHDRLKGLVSQTSGPDRVKGDEALEEMRQRRDDAGPISPFANTFMKWMQSRTAVQRAVGEKPPA